MVPSRISGIIILYSGLECKNQHFEMQTLRSVMKLKCGSIYRNANAAALVLASPRINLFDYSIGLLATTKFLRQ